MVWRLRPLDDDPPGGAALAMMFKHDWEVEMPTLNTLKILAPLAVVVSLAINPAFGATKGMAGKKLTREQAWAFCKAKLDERFGWD